MIQSTDSFTARILVQEASEVVKGGLQRAKDTERAAPEKLLPVLVYLERQPSRHVICDLRPRSHLARWAHTRRSQLRKGTLVLDTCVAPDTLPSCQAVVWNPPIPGRADVMRRGNGRHRPGYTCPYTSPRLWRPACSHT